MLITLCWTYELSLFQTRLTICEGHDGTETSNGDVLIFPDMVRYRYVLLILKVVCLFLFFFLLLFPFLDHCGQQVLMELQEVNAF